MFSFLAQKHTDCHLRTSEVLVGSFGTARSSPEVFSVYSDDMLAR